MNDLIPPTSRENHDDAALSYRLRLAWERFKLAVSENWLRLRGIHGECERCARYEAALREAHTLADEAVHGTAIRFSVCSRIRTLTSEVLDAKP